MRYLPLVMLLAAPCRAGTISDTDTTLLLHSGDSLSFEILTWNFSFHAARLGTFRYPTDLSFTFVTAPVDAPASLSVWLDSVPVAGPLTFTTGFYSGSQYRGPVSMVQGYLHLDPALSAEIVASGAVDFIIRNDGAELLLGLPPNTLRQDLSLSLSGGPLSVGTFATSVSLNNSVPEPGTRGTVALALAVLCLARFALWRLAGVTGTTASRTR